MEPVKGLRFKTDEMIVRAFAGKIWYRGGKMQDAKYGIEEPDYVVTTAPAKCAHSNMVAGLDPRYQVCAQACGKIEFAGGS